MDWLTNEFLFYGGMALSAFSLLLTILYFCISKIKSVKLKVKLDAEYGARSNTSTHK